MTCILYPWESPALASEQAAETAQQANVEHEAWLDAFLADAYEAWLDDVEPAWLTDWLEDVETAVATVADPAYVPFQHTEHYAQLADEVGYLESTAPYLF